MSVVRQLFCWTFFGGALHPQIKNKIRKITANKELLSMGGQFTTMSVVRQLLCWEQLVQDMHVTEGLRSHQSTKYKLTASKELLSKDGQWTTMSIVDFLQHWEQLVHVMLVSGLTNHSPSAVHLLLANICKIKIPSCQSIARYFKYEF